MTLYQLILLQILSKKTPFIRSWKNSVGNKTLPVIPSDASLTFKEPSRMEREMKWVYSPEMFRTFRQISTCLNIMHLFHLQDPNMDETPNSILCFLLIIPSLRPQRDEQPRFTNKKKYI